MRTTTRQFLRTIATAGALAALTLVALGAPAANVPVPELSVSLRGVVDDTLERGEPLPVAVRLESAGDGAVAVELAPAAGTWADAVAVELLSAGSGAVVARATAVGAPASPRATLDRGRIAGGMWMFPASATQGLAPGNYVVRARLSITNGTGWKGEVSSDEVPLSVVAVSSAPERVSARTLGRAQIAFAQNSFEDAARLLDAVLVNAPDDFDLLCLRADVALGGGNPLAAMLCVSRAARTLAPKTPGPPPLILHDVQSRVFAARLAATASPANPPAWTWPPLSVMTLRENEAAALIEEASATPAPGATPAATTPAAASAPTMAASSPAVAATKSPLPGTPSSAVLPAQPSNAPSIGTVVPASELADAKIIADAAGQWAASANAGTQYGKSQYSAAQAVGAPNISVAGNSPDAWCPANKNNGTDWLEVSFAKPVHATEVRVRQNDAAGAMVKIEAIEPDGTAHVWWEGVDPYKAPALREIVWFAVRVPKTEYLVAQVKITLNLAAMPGWKEVDAVQLVSGD